MISTSAMVASGAVYGNLMVRVRPTNRKLRDRAERLVMRLTGLERGAAGPLLKESDDDVRLAVLVHRKEIDLGTARMMLIAAHGSLRSALS